MKGADYVVNVGEVWDNLQPVDAAFTKEDAIKKAKVTNAKCQEVVYSPVDDVDIDEIVWRNNNKKF